jgi:hypothetical protein
MVRQFGAVLILLLLGAGWLEDVQAASRKDREDAIAAGQRRKATRGSGGQIQKAGPDQGRNKADVFAECLNSMQTTMGA